MMTTAWSIEGAFLVRKHDFLGNNILIMELGPAEVNGHIPNLSIQKGLSRGRYSKKMVYTVSPVLDPLLKRKVSKFELSNGAWLWDQKRLESRRLPVKTNYIHTNLKQLKCFGWTYRRKKHFII